MGNCACCGQRENETAHSAELTATTIQSAKSLQDALTLDEAWQQAGSNVPDDDDESKDSKESKENNSKPICLMDKLVNQANVFDTEIERKKKIWKELDFFCLDNSIRETTVGQLASHTLTDKQNIFKELKKCGLTDIIVASFSSATKIDDTFVQWLQQVHGDDFDKFYSFSEVTIGVDYDEEGNSLHRYNSGDSVDDLPDGMKKNKFFGLRHTVFEMDFANNDDVTWGETWSVDDMCNLLDRRIRWVKDNICKEGRNFLNIRDFPFIMAEDVRRMLDIIKYLAEMPLEYRLFGIIYEDPVGECLPEQLAAWTRCIRDTMTACGWDDGKLLNHIHGKLGYKDAVTMDCLANGSDGMWAAVCEEGAAVGHCCTTVTMLNLIRHGNSKILEKYNCTHLRQAAINVTKITTKAPPHPKQIVYGERATDLVIGVLGIGFDIGKYFGIEYESRITTIATPEMIITRLKNIFGENEQFTIEMAIKMKEEIEHDLTMDIKSEYHSPYGIAMLFLRAGGKGSEGMMKILQKHNEHVEVYEKIKAEIRKEWNKYTINDIDVKQKVKHTRGTGSRAVLATMRRKMSRRYNNFYVIFFLFYFVFFVLF